LKAASEWDEWTLHSSLLHAARAEAEIERLRDDMREAEAWLSGLAESFAGRYCEDEDHDANGEREGNTCFDSEVGDLDFPDDWCWRCYVLKCVTEARAALGSP
jgi:hypothetical protein